MPLNHLAWQLEAVLFASRVTGVPSSPVPRTRALGSVREAVRVIQGYDPGRPEGEKEDIPDKSQGWRESWREERGVAKVLAARARRPTTVKYIMN